LFAIWIAKSVIFIGKILNKKTTSMPGVLALKICPNIIRILSKFIKKEIIVVCGTNGKTTVNNILCSFIENYRIDNCEKTIVVCNKFGANMPSGIVTSLIEKTNIFGKLSADYACFEIDEAYVTKIFDFLTPHVVVITNLFRDQLDRYGEIDSAIKLIENALKKVKNSKLVLNADDPLIAEFGLEKFVIEKTDENINLSEMDTESKHVFYSKEYSFKKKENIYYFGIDEKISDNMDEVREGRFCILCGSKMYYEYYHYGQLGKYFCENCGYKCPEIDFAAKDIVFGESFKINEKVVKFLRWGIYDIYNVLAALSAISVCGIQVDFLKVHYPFQLGRMEEIGLNNMRVFLNLSKNPAGFNQAIHTILKKEEFKSIIIVINDNVNDGKDVSWIWDVDFEKLNNDKICFIGVAGSRFYDVALRFKYSEIAVDYFSEDIKQTICESFKSRAEVCYILVNYTALFTTRNIILEIRNNFNKNELKCC
jgi:UDP-N-acetylmuramyl tripeptide synthase